MSYATYKTAEPLLAQREEFRNSAGSFSAKWLSTDSLPQPRDASSDAEYIAYTDVHHSVASYDQVYVVFSYTTPIYVSDEKTTLWVNPIKYSTTTSKQQNLIRRVFG